MENGTKCEKKLLTEDFVPKNVGDLDLETIFKKFIGDTQIGNDEVTIADQYIFFNGTDISLLAKIIEDNIKSKKVRFVCNETKVDKGVQNNLVRLLKNKNFKIRFEKTISFHDRYRYSKSGGFLICASFNTFKKAPTIIKKLDASELYEIIKYYKL